MEKETFESVLKEKLGNHEMPVNPALWKSVSTQAGISSGAAGLGLGAWIGIVSSIVAIAVGVVYFTLDNEKPATVKREKHTPEITNEPSKTEFTPKALSKEETSKNHTGNLKTEPVIEDRFGIAEEGTPSSNIEVDLSLHVSKNESFNAPLSVAQEIIKAPSPSTVIVNNCPQPTALTELLPTEKTSVKKIIVMPNAITPNGDGINDVLSLDSEGLTDFNVVILDAANTLVYSSTDPSFKWNGTLLNGDPAPAGTYQYYFTAKDENGTWCNQFSSLTILR
ncbi:MAG: gliding motility-associated C-terminal domain-containing protein [Cryomorphaceae bacterium]|jgi:gliding motility-associated-like protein|nr:gliding motility-associated C-terminal domain-containing protein [Cryomorphaceae bacterium]